MKCLFCLESLSLNFVAKLIISENSRFFAKCLKNKVNLLVDDDLSFSMFLEQSFCDSLDGAVI